MSTVKCRDFKCPRYLNCAGREHIPSHYAGTECSIMKPSETNPDATRDHGRDIIIK